MTMAKGTLHLSIASTKEMRSRERYTRICAKLEAIRKSERIVAELTKVKK